MLKIFILILLSVSCFSCSTTRVVEKEVVYIPRISDMFPEFPKSTAPDGTSHISVGKDKVVLDVQYYSDISTYKYNIDCIKEYQEFLESIYPALPIETLTETLGSDIGENNGS